MTLRQKNKLFEKINQFKTIKNNSTKNYNRYYKRNKSFINKIVNNNTSKFNNSNNMNSSINGNNCLCYINSSSTNNVFNSSTTNNFYNNNSNSLKGSYFFYKNNIQNKSQYFNNSRSINPNNFVTLRNILTNTSHKINDINEKLKKYIRKNKDIYTISYSENYNQKPKKIKIKKAIYMMY